MWSGALFSWFNYLHLFLQQNFSHTHRGVLLQLLLLMNVLVLVLLLLNSYV